MIAPVNYIFPDALKAAIAPPKRLPVADWCDENRFLDAKYAAEPGRWSTARAPYLREILNAFADPGVGSIIFLKCARVGGTEFLNNILGFTVDARPMPVLYVLPTEPAVNEEFKGRIKSIFEGSPSLKRHIISDAWATESSLHLDTCEIYGAWASAPGTLIRRTMGVVVFDEVDNCDLAAGRLGNTWDVATERTVTFKHRAKCVAVTTPTTEDATGFQLYQASDKRRCYVPCPHCGKYQVLVFENLKWPEGKTADEIRQDKLADLVCIGCGSLVHQDDQPWMVARCVWVPECQTIAENLPLQDADIVARAALPSVGTGVLAGWDLTGMQWAPRLDGMPPRGRARGYHINSLYSPWRTWSEIAAKFLDVKDDPERFRVFKNSWLGLAWQHTTIAPDETWVQPKITAAKYPAKQAPPEAKLIITTFDVQQHSLFYLSRAWGVGAESWLVDYDQVESFEAVYNAAFVKGYPIVGDPSRVMRAYACIGDARYRQDEVLEWSKRPGVSALHGYESRKKPVTLVNLALDKNADPKMVWEINTNLFKSQLARAMLTASGQPAAWNLCQNASPEYVRHITSEHFTYGKNKKGNKKWSWKPKTEGRPNHWWDCETYQMAMVEILQERGELSVSSLHSLSPARGIVTVAWSKLGSPQTPALRPTRQTRITSPFDRR